MAPTTNPIKVVIIGGGYAGANLAKNLDGDNKIQVTLIERRTYFFHNVASPRAMVDEVFRERIVIPYSKLFKNPNNKVVHSTVTAITKTQVTLEDNQTVPFDYLVIATGTSYSEPIKFDEVHTEVAKKTLANTAEEIKNAQSILVVGGGAVGVEIAAEIAVKYADKKVTLVHGQAQLIPSNLPDKFKAKLLAEVEKLNIKVVLNDRIDIPEGFNPHEKKTLVTQKGVAIESDIQFICTGTKPNTELIGQLDASLLDERKLVKVDNHLRLASAEYENIFAIGDITNTAEAKMSFVATQHAGHLAKVLSTVAQGKKKVADTAPYQLNTMKMMVIALGPNGGVGTTPMGMLGNFLTKAMKAKDLFTSPTRKTLGQTA